MLSATSEWEQIDLAKSPGGSRAPSEVRAQSEERRLWWRWEDSEIQIHHAKADERIAKKRQEILEEMKRREEEQCTFTPRLIARRSKSCGRVERQGRSLEVSPCNGRWQDWLDQQLESKKSKLESVESEMYRDVTHQPQITRRAQSLAKEREAESQSVFDRLYHVARERSKARKELEAAAESTPLRTPRTQERRRTTDVYESLYAQGLEQRARHAEQAEQAAKQAKRQILGRSREYYWQMLDRQIRDAFDKATEGSHLAYTQLEDFLRYFGVMAHRTNEAATPLAAERIQEDG